MGDNGTSGFLIKAGVEFLNDESGFDAMYNYNEKNFRFISTPATDKTLYPTGKPEVPVLSARSNSASIRSYGRRELEINDNQIESLTIARLRAQAELSRRKEPSRKIVFNTYSSSVEPGDTVTITVPSYGINTGNFIVQKVDTMPHLAVDSGSKKFQYKLECVNTEAKDWIDFLRDAFTSRKREIEPNEDEDIEDIVDHSEEISVQDAHTIKTPTDHTEELSVQDAHTLNTVTSGSWKWSNDGGTTTDKLRWKLGDWGT